MIFGLILIVLSISKEINAQSYENWTLLAAYENGGFLADLIQLPNGYIVTSSPDNNSVFSNIQIRDPMNGVIHKNLTGHTNSLRSFAYLPRNGILASGSCDNTIKLWNTTTWTLIKTLTGHDLCVLRIVVLPNGNLVSIGSFIDGTFKIWNASNNFELVRSTRLGANILVALALLSDGNLAIGDNSNNILIVDPNNGSLLKQISNGQRTSSIVVLSNGDFATNREDKYVQIWNGNDYSLKRNVSNSTMCYRLASLPNNHLACGSDNQILIWNLSSGQLVRSLISNVRETFWSVCFLESGQLASSSRESIKMWGSSLMITSTTAASTTKMITTTTVKPTTKSTTKTTKKFSTKTTTKKTTTKSAATTKKSSIKSTTTTKKSSTRTTTTSKKPTTKSTSTTKKSSTKTTTTTKNLTSATTTTTKIVTTKSTTTKLTTTTMPPSENWKSLRTYNSSESNIVNIIELPNQYIAAAFQDFKIQVLDLITGIVETNLTGHTKSIMSLVYLPENGLLASSSCDKTIKLWNTTIGMIVKTLYGHKGCIYKLIVLPNGNLVSAGGANDMTIKIWNASNDFTLVRSISFSDMMYPSGLALLNDGNLAICDGDLYYEKSIFIVNPNNGSLVKKIPVAQTREFWSILTFSNGDFLTNSADGYLIIWNRTDYSLKQNYSINRMCYGLAILPNNDLICTSYYFWPLIIKLSSDQIVQVEGLFQVILGVWVFKSGYLATANWEMKLTIWGNSMVSSTTRVDKITQPYENWKLLRTYQHGGDLANIIELPNGYIVASLRDLDIQIRDPATGVIHMNLTGHTSMITSFVYLPRNGLIASSSYDMTIKIWNATNGTLIKTLISSNNYVFKLAVLPNGDLISSGSFDDRTVKIWNSSNDFTLVRSISLNNDLHSRDMAVLNDGNLAICDNSNKNILIVNPNDGSLVRKIQTSNMKDFWSILTLPNGDFVTSFIDGSVKIWSGNDYSLKQNVTNSAYCYEIAYLTDNYLACGSYNKTLILSLLTGQVVTTLYGHTSLVGGVCLLRNGLLVTSSFEMMYVWRSPLISTTTNLITTTTTTTRLQVT